MATFFSRIKEGLKKTTPTFYKAFSSVGGMFGGRTIDASALDELEEALYTADFGVETSEEILEEIRAAYKKDPDLRGQEAAEIGARVLERALEGAARPLDLAAHQPHVIMLVGINGSGKTTTTAKLAKLWQDAGQSPLVAACDTFRAAANEQIKAWCERLHIPLVASQHGADAAAVAFDAMQAAQSRGSQVLLLDTAGRLHNKAHLMKELEKIKRVIGKHDALAPHETWLVVDGSLGSNSIDQARTFHQAVGLTGLVITKLDGTSRGGAIVGIYRELGVPIHYVGLGEQPEDLQAFEPRAYARAIFGLEG